MAATINVAGLVTIKVDAGSGLEILGYSADMADATDQSFWHDVPGDLHGGPQGPPIDSQYLGQITRIRLELSKFDASVANKVRARLNAATAGTIADANIGDLALQDSKTIRLLLSSAGDPINFPLCMVKDAVEMARGTKYSTFVCEFEAHRNQTTGVLFNAVEV